MRAGALRRRAKLPGPASEPASKWLARFKAEGRRGLADRSSRPRRCPLALTPQEQRQLELRRQRWPLWRIVHSKPGAAWARSVGT